MSDFSELLSLSADLSAAGERVRPFAEKALQVTARHVKDEARKKASRRGLRAYAKDIDYEVRSERDAIVAEVGPTPNGDAGGLGIVEDAPGGVRSAPQHALRDALKNNVDDFERGMLLAALDALKGVA